MHIEIIPVQTVATGRNPNRGKFGCRRSLQPANPLWWKPECKTVPEFDHNQSRAQIVVNDLGSRLDPVRFSTRADRRLILSYEILLVGNC